MDDREIHLQDYLYVILERKYIVLSFMMVTFIFSIFNVMSSIPFYVASTKVMFEINELNPLNKHKPLNVAYTEFFETQFQIIKSPVFLERVADKIITQNKEKISGNVDTNSQIKQIQDNNKKIEVNSNNTTEKENKEILIKKLSSNLSIELIPDSNIALVSYKSMNSSEAAQIANLIVESYIEYSIDVKLKFSKVSLNWMDKKSKEALSRLEASKQKLQNYMKENDILTIEDRMAIIPQKLSQLSSRLTAVEAERRELEVIYKKINELPENLLGVDSLPVITSDKFLQLIEQQILSAEQKVLELSNKYGEKHPVMIRAQNDLKILQEKKINEIKKIIGSEKKKYELLESKEKNLKKLFLETKQQAVELNEKSIHLDILQKEIETNQYLYNSLISQMKEQELVSDVQNININVLEPAEIPINPISSNKRRKIIIGLILGLLGGIGVAFFIEYLDQTIKSPYEVAQRFGIPVLGAVPHLKSKTSKIDDIVIKEPISFLAECYKTIRMSILLSSDKKPPKSVLITSHAAGDGKTTTSVNLAAAIAQTENTVLLIDGDLRRSSVHKNLNLDNSIGLSTLLVGTSKAKGVIQKGPLPNMSVITAGPPPINPSELYCSKRMSVLMELLQKKFDYVIIDAPIMGVTDSLILSKYADGTIVVVKVGRTTYEFLNAGLTALNDIKANILGIVVNGLSSEKSKHYYYSNEDDYFSVNPSGYFNSPSDISQRS